MINKTDIKELTYDQLVSWVKRHDIKPFHARQIVKWIYIKQADTFDVMTDLEKSLRELLSENFTINRLEKVCVETSKDSSSKYLFKLEDGEQIESVLIPEKDHYTLCISTQVGCAQGCRFCLTGRGGFSRNLTRGEIIGQVRDVSNDLNESMSLTNIVLMGMGEPLANYKNVVAAVNTITDRELGLGFSSRRVTISTAGLVPELSNLGNETKAGIAVSLNATDNRTRTMLMPINRKNPIEKLLDACRRYKLPHRRKITFEYILIKGINDSADDAKRLVKLLKSIKAKINLIPFNEHEGCDFKRSEKSVIDDFKEILQKNRYTTIIRHSKGSDISAACGQLKVRSKTG